MPEDDKEPAIYEWLELPRHLYRIERLAISTNEKLDLILKNQEKIMATLADVQAAVTAEDTVIDSAMALIQGLAAQVAALAPNQAAIDALAADIKGKSDALAAAVAANTATPAPAPAPAPST